MGRPSSSTNIGLEKALTRTICNQVLLTSGLTMAELETAFSIGTTDSFGKKTSKTFSRYCEADPSKSQAANRDTLQRIVKISLDRGWLNQLDTDYLGLREVLMIDHKRASEVFEERKRERDALVKILRELRAAVQKTLELNRASQTVRAARYTSQTGDDYIWKTHLELRHTAENLHSVHFDDQNGDKAPLPDCIAPLNLNGCLELLEECLDTTYISFYTGETPMPLPNPARLVSRREKIGDIDFSDIETLIREVEKWCKSGAVR